MKDVNFTVGGIYRFKPTYSEDIPCIVLPTIEAIETVYEVSLGIQLPIENYPIIFKDELVVLLTEPYYVRTSMIRFVKVLTSSGDVGWIPFELDMFKNV